MNLCAHLSCAILAIGVNASVDLTASIDNAEFVYVSNAPFLLVWLKLSLLVSLILLV